MNIVIATWSYYPSKDGVQMVTQYEAEGLAKIGHNVIVLAPLKEGFKREEVINGVKIIRFYHKLRLRTSVGEKKEFQAFLLEHKKEIDVFVAVCAQAFPYMWSKNILDKMDCRKVLYMHGMRPEHIDFKKLHDLHHLPKEMLLTPYWNLFFRRNWKKLLKFDAVCHLFENDDSHQYFKKYGYKHNYVIPNCCEDELFVSEPVENLQRIKDKYQVHKPYFLLVANYGERKNQKEAVEAYYQSEENTCALICIGSRENTYAKEVEELNEALSKMYPQKEKAKLLYGISREDTRFLIMASYATLMVSQNEYFPITIAEGMAAGKPFLSSNVGVVSMLPGGNIYHNRTELRYWLNYYQMHPDYVKSLGEIAHDYADKNMKIEIQVKKLEDILKGEC